MVNGGDDQQTIGAHSGMSPIATYEGHGKRFEVDFLLFRRDS